MSITYDRQCADVDFHGGEDFNADRYFESLADARDELRVFESIWLHTDTVDGLEALWLDGGAK